MTYRATVSCDQPDCTTAITGTAADIDHRLRSAGWTPEVSNGTWSHTCPNHKPDTLTVAQRDMVDAGTRVLYELQVLDELGYYTASCSRHGDGTPEEQEHIGDGCVLHVYLLDNEYPTGPYVQIVQQGHRIRARLRAGDEGEADTVVLNEWAEEWGA